MALEPLEDRRLLAVSLTEDLTESVSVSSVELLSGDRTLIEIGGPLAGNPDYGDGNNIDGYDQIQIQGDGNATLDGTLEIRLVNDYLPDVGTTFDFLTLTGGSISGLFVDGEGLWFPSGDRFCYFDIVPIANGLQLEVKEMPSDLQFEPNAADEDDFGEFMSDYFDTASFTFSGGLSVPGFVELSGSFTISEETDGFTVSANGINAFLGTGGETPETIDDTGFQVNAAELDLRVFTPASGLSTYALAASGGLALVGLDGLDITGSATIQVSTHNVPVDMPTGIGTVSVDAEVQSLTAGVAMSVGNTLALSGDLSATRARSGAIFVDIPEASLAIKAHIDEPGTEEVFGIGGGVRFSLGGDEGFRLLDMGLTSVSVFGVSLNATAGTAFMPLGDDHPGDPASGFEVELTSLPGGTVDANLLNRRQYIDVTFFTPSGTNVDHASIDASDLALTGPGALDAQVSTVEWLDSDTARFHLIDQNTTNDVDLFGAGPVQVAFPAESWQNDALPPDLSPLQEFTATVRDGAANGTTPMSAGPLSIAGPHIGIEDLQFKRVGDATRLTVTVGIGADAAALDFGGGQSSSGVTVLLTDLLGTFDLGADVGLSGVDNVSAAFGFYVGGLVAEVPDVMIVSASEISVNYDPRKDTDGDGIVSTTEQQAYDNREIIGVGSVSIEIPKVGVTGSIANLSVRNNGFSVGTAMLTKNGLIDLGGILELEGVSVGVTDFGVTFGQAVDFDGEIFIASGGAKLFPGKSFTASATTVYCALTFTDGTVDGFKFTADQFELELGSYLVVTGTDILIDTGAAANEEVASFASLGAKLNAGPLRLSGEMRNFAFLGNGDFDTKAGFGVFFNRDTADSKAFKWPSWMPIRITSVGAHWNNINADPLDFQVTVSAALTGLHNLPLDVSGAVEGLVIDVGLLLDGKFPITAMESLAVGVEGKLFGGDAKGSLLGGIVRFDSNGVVIAADDTTTPVEDRVLYVGLDAAFTMAGVGGFGLKMAFSELGPLGVLITASTPTGILLEPISGLSINDFVAGVEFFKSLPALTEPEQLRDASLEPVADLDPDLWLASVKDQVVDQYLAIQDNPNQAGFLAAFTEPMTITAGAKIYTQYTSQYAFNGQVELRLSTDGKFLATGKLSFFNGALSTEAKLYANLSEIAKGNATVLLLADIPDEFRFLVIEGKFQMQFQDGSGQSMEFDFADPDDTSLPVANLAGPADGSTIGLASFRGRGYLDVAYVAKGDATIDQTSINGDEVLLKFPGSTEVLLALDDPQPEGFAAENKFRYVVPEALELVPGEIEIEFIQGSFADSDAQTNEAETETFRLSVPEAELSMPTDGGQTDLRALNSAGYITVRFRPTPGAVLDIGSLLDVEQEIILSGPGLGSVVLNGIPTQVDDSTSFKYQFTGDFSTGPVQVTYVPGSFDETDAVDGTVNTYIDDENDESFTVVGPTAQLLDRNIDVVLLNERGYLEVQFDASFGATLVESSLTDPDAEFTLSNGIAVAGVPTNPSGDGVTWRYAFAGQFELGEVSLDFAAGAWSDTLDGVVLNNLAESQTLTVLGPTIELIWPQGGMTGVGVLNQNRYIDVKFRPTWGNLLDESTVFDGLAEFSLSGSAVSGIVTVEEIPEALGDGVYRYDFTGDLQPGELEIVFAAGAVVDLAGYGSLAQTQVVTLVELTADLAYPVAGSRVSASEINDVSCRYLDVTFADPLGVGLDEASITDPEPEIELWTKNDQGDEVLIGSVHLNGTPTFDPDAGTWRYSYTGDLPIGPVIVKYLAGTWGDEGGNVGSAGLQTFLVTPTAANLSIYVGGSVEVFAGTEDVRLLHVGGEVLLQAESGVQGSRVQVDMNGQIDLLYLGTVGAAAGRFVLEDPSEGEAGMWGVLRIDTNFQKLEDLGIVLDAYCLLEVNTTSEAKSETLTLPGQAEDGSDLTRTFDFGPEMFRIEAAGTAALHVPPFLNGGTLGTELACIEGTLLLDVSRYGLEAFAAGQLSLGPPQLGFNYQAQGVLIINDDGFAAEVAIMQSFGMGDFMQFEAAAHVTVNVTRQEQSVEIPQEMLQYLPPMALDSLTGPGGGPYTGPEGGPYSYAVPEGPPQRDGSPGAAGAYVVLGAEGVLTIADAFELDGNFWVEVSEERFLLDAEASLLLGPIGSFSANGILIVDGDGVRTRIEADAQLGSQHLGLTIAGDAVFQVNTTDQPWDHDDLPATPAVPADSLEVAVDASFDFLGFAEGDGDASVTYENGDFQLVINGTLNLANVLDVDVHAYVGIFDDDPATTTINEGGVIVDASVDLDLELWGIVDLDIDGHLQVNTTDVTMSGYQGAILQPDGSLAFGQIDFVDAYGADKALQANSFFLDLKGELELLSVLNFSGRTTIDMAGGAFVMEIAMGVNFFGIGWLDAEGAFNSEGEYSIDIDGSVSIGVWGCGLFGEGWLNLSYMDDNGTDLDGNGNYVLDVHAGFNVRAELFHVTLVGAGVAFNYDQGTGRMSARTTVKFLWWSKSYTFYIGCLETPPPACLAGDASGNSGAAGFTGGELYLNMGDRAQYRDPARTDVNEVDECFTVEYRGWSTEHGHTVRVHAFGVWEDYHDVTRIVADSGNGIDTIRVLSDEPVPVPVDLYGGDDDDFLELSALVSEGFVDGGPGVDRVTVTGENSAQDLRVTLESENTPWVKSYSDTIILSEVELTGVETIGLSGGDGADRFSVSGELDLAGVKSVVVDLGSDDSDLDQVQLTLSDDNDDFEFAPFDVGMQSVWKNHFTFDVLGGSVSDGDKMDLYAQAGADQVTVYRDPENSFGGTPSYLTTGGSPVGLAYTFHDTDNPTVIDALVVDTAEDESDGIFVAGDLSLREAIARTNAGGEDSSVDTIFFALPLAGNTITLALGQLSINDNLTITGPSANRLTINAARASRIFSVDDGDGATRLTVDVGNLSLVDGKSSGHGGGIYNQENLTVEDCVLTGNWSSGHGGAIFSEGELSVIDSRIARNKADVSGTNTGDGGAICSSGIISVVDSVITDNWSGVHGGAIAVRVDSTATLRNSTISESAAEGHGGGIYSLGTLSVIDSMVADNISDCNNNNYGDGGGIYSGGTLTVAGSTISGNRSYDHAGGIFADSNSTTTLVSSTISANSADGHAGGIYNLGTLSVAGSTIASNMADVNNSKSDELGGGIYNRGSLTVENSTISDNSTYMWGGGIYNGADCTLEILNSTISGNYAGYHGGGVFGDSYGNVTVLNSTIYGNEVGHSGGGLFNRSSGTLTVVNSTITKNIADNNNNGTGTGGGIFNSGTCFTTLHNTIVAGNIRRTSTADNVSGTAIQSSSSHNLIGVDPLSVFLTGDLQNHGGPTQTVALLSDSPAIDTGDNATATAYGLATDQRGGPFARIHGAAVDVGACELQFVVTTTVDENDGIFVGGASLRELIELTNATPGANTINFAPSLAGSTITLSLGELQITDDLTINGLGADQLTISGNSTHQIFVVDNESPATTITVRISGLSLVDGWTIGQPPVLRPGGGIYNMENLTVEACTIANNEVIYDGGGVFNQGTLVVSNSTISGNLAGRHGGGIANVSGNLTVVNSTIAGNSAGHSGGGIVNWLGGTLNAANSTIVYNTGNADGDALGSGGGIRTSDDSVNITTLHNTIVALNVRGLGSSQTPDDLSGTNVDPGSSYNLIGDAATAGGLIDDASGNQVGYDPLLDPAGLRDHGGPTPMIALLSGSLAIDKGSNAEAAGLTTDQRGLPYARVYGDAVDVGAYEVQFVVDTTEDESDGDFSPGDLSLREATELTNAKPGADTITFAPGLAGSTITLTLGELEITDDVELVGQQITLNANGGSRVLLVQSGAAATIRNFTITGGNAAHGGGIFNEGQLTVVNTTISGNTATGTYGGGIYSLSGTVTIENSTIANNTSNSHAGGIANVGGALVVVNSTIAYNTASNSGGAIVNWMDGTLNVTNSTIACNTADSNGDSFGLGGGIDSAGGGANMTTLHNTIVACNVHGAVGSQTADDLSGTVETGSSHNLIGDAASSGGLVHESNGNQVGLDPLLDPAGLQDHGGPTRTIALLPASPAIDAGSNAAAAGLTSDQRGEPFDRIFTTTVDVGAYELQALVVDTTVDESDGIYAGDVSLRDAVAWANVNPGADTILFHPNLADSVITLTAGQLQIMDDLTITAPAASSVGIFGNNAHRIFLVDNGNAATTINVHISGLGLAYGKIAGDHGGAISNRENLTLEGCTLVNNQAAGHGGAIYNAGTLVVSNSTITGNTADYNDSSTEHGGGIYTTNGTLYVATSTISGNRSYGHAGGIFVDSNSTATVLGSTIFGNYADGHGGGVYSLGALSLDLSIISGNTADYNGSNSDLGGGIYTNGTLTVLGSMISDNLSNGAAGGIFADTNSATTLYGATISGNTADGHAGGIYNLGTLSVVDSIIDDNEADANHGGSGDGGGIYNSGTASIENSTISGNNAYEYGGGIVNGATLEVLSSTISGNCVSYHGGGIHNSSSGIAKVHNSTIFGNSCGYSGGGVINWGGMLTMVNSTIAENIADSNSNGTGGGGGIRTPSGSTTLHNTIVSGNVRRTSGPVDDDLNGAVAAGSSYNLIGDAATAGGLTNDVNFNQVGVDPLLNPAGLQDHGGSTLTVALLPDSPAIDAGDDDLAVDPSDDPLAFDQRGSGFPRIVHAAVDIGAFEVQNAAPTVVDVVVSPGVNEGSELSLTALFNDDWVGETHTATINWGDGTSSEAGVVTEPTASDGTVTGSHVYAASGSYTVTVTVTDNSDAPTSDTLVVTINNVAPTVEAGADREVDEGSVLNLTASFGDVGTGDTHTATINWGDGTPSVAGLVMESPTGVDGMVAASYVYADNGIYTVTVTVFDEGASTSDTLLVTVDNVAPTVSAGADRQVGEGLPLGLAATFVDPGMLWAVPVFPASLRDNNTGRPATYFTGPPDDTGFDLLDLYTVTFDFGQYRICNLPGRDFNVYELDSGTAEFDDIRVYVSENGMSYRDVTATAGPALAIPGDEAHGSTQYARSYEISGTGLSSVRYVRVKGIDDDWWLGFGNRGFELDAVGAFAWTAEPHTATIDWGDGTPVEAGVVAHSGMHGTVGGSHVYADTGIYTVTVTVTDDDGGSTSDTLLVTVNNAAPTVSAGADREVDTGSAVDLTASFNDVGTQDTHTATIDWGDGTPAVPGVVTQSPTGGGTVAGSHVYAEVGIYTVTVTVVDNHGGSGSDTLIVTVTPAPTVSAGADKTVDEGSIVSLAASFHDPEMLWNVPYFPMSLLDNTTGKPSYYFTGAPDDTAFDLEDQYRVTFDFGQYRICDLAGRDFNVYEVDSGTDEFEDIRVYVSANGISFYDVTGTAGPALAIPGDEAHGSTQYARSYDIHYTGLPLVRYVRVSGIDDDLFNGGFELDAVGAFVWTPITHTATIDWGDGTVEAGVVTEPGIGAGTVAGSHMYADSGVYTVTVTVTDEEGGFGTDTLLVTVNNVAPTLSGLSVTDAEPGLTATLTGLIDDPCPADTFTLTVDWGDGSPIDTFPYAAGTTSFTEVHAYAADGPGGPYSITIGIEDDDLGSSAETIVTNVAHLKDTAATDVIAVTFGTPGGVWHQVEINGTVVSYDPAIVDTIHIDGLGGADTITIVGTGENETVVLIPGTVSLIGQTYEFHATNVESILIDAGTGTDQAAMTGSSGSNRLYSYADSTRMSDSTGAYSYRLDGFDDLTIDAPGSGRNYAFFYDSPQDDTFDADPVRVVMTRAAGAADETATTATGFERVYAYSTAGDNDQAVLTGSDATSNRLYSYDDYSILADSARSFYFYTRGFDAVTANSPGVEPAYAYLYGSQGNDALTATPSSATMNREAPWSDTTANGFTRLYAYSTQGGVDSAELTGSDAGGNTFRGYPDYATLTDAVHSFYHYARGFRSVTATGSEADPSSDRAYLYDSSGDDTLFGRGHQCYLEDTAGTTYHNEVLYFDYVYARSTDEDDATDDSVDVENLAYHLLKYGSW